MSRHGAATNNAPQWRLVELMDNLPSSLGKKLEYTGRDFYELKLSGLTADEIRLIGKTLKENGVR